MSCRQRPLRATKQQRALAYTSAMFLARFNGCACEPEMGEVRHVNERGYIFPKATLHHERGCALCRA